VNSLRRRKDAGVLAMEIKLMDRFAGNPFSLNESRLGIEKRWSPDGFA
jgi:hypothetical protein